MKSINSFKSYLNKNKKPKFNDKIFDRLYNLG